MTAGHFTVNIKESKSEKSNTGTEEISKKPSSKKGILILTGVVVLIVVVAAITLASLYFGTLFHQESFKKFTKERHTPAGEAYKEEFEVSTDELIVSYTVGTAVFDRKRGLLIFKEKNGTSKCYVSPYNVTDIPDATKLEKILETPEEDKAEIQQLIDYRLHPTGVSLAYKSTLSQAANKVCEGSDIEWAYLSKESGLRIHKRRAPPHFEVKITKDGCTISCSFSIGGANFVVSVDIPWSMLKKN